MSDEQLMRSASRGDGLAFETLVRKLAPDVYAYLTGMLGDEREAEEAFEETFVRAVRSIDRYAQGQDVRRWILGIARRVAADLRPTPSASPGPIPEAVSEQVPWARRALRSLPIEHREVLVCREVLGWDLDDIAATLDIPPAELPSRLDAARSELGSKMAEVV